MALTSLLLLLFVIFRRSEQWMRQHILKVGWLLTHNRTTAAVFYYTALLPGIALHEACRWLTAGILNVRATRSIQLSQPDESDEIQQSLVRISPNAPAAKRMTIEAVPMLVALAALWLIATDILGFESTLRIAASGSVADLSQAIGRLLTQPDVGLWFYMMFAIANTMLPPIPQELRKRYRVITLLILSSAFVFGLGSATESMAMLGSYSRRLLSSLSFILFATSIINFVMALALGTIEAIIERLTSHSATFLEGKMITLTRQEALAREADLKRQVSARRSTRDAPRPEKQIRSIYALPLPIPGSPGIEPVSKPVAAVLNVRSAIDPGTKSIPDQKTAAVAASDAMNKRRKLSARPQRMPDSIERATINFRSEPSAEPAEKSTEQPPAAEPLSPTLPADIEQEASAPAPFSRPFSAPPEEIEDPDGYQDSPATVLAYSPYSRPFAPAPASPAALEAGDSDANKASRRPEKELPASAPSVVRARTKPITRPVPKPSQRAEPDDSADDVEELQYEPLDEGELYDDEDVFDADSS